MASTTIQSIVPVAFGLTADAVLHLRGKGLLASSSICPKLVSLAILAILE